MDKAESHRMGQEVRRSPNSENAAESDTTGRESVEELQTKQEQYPVWRSTDDSQQTLEYLSDGGNHDLKSLDMTYIEMGEVDAKRIGAVVASHQSLEVLTIKLDSVHISSSPTSMWPMDSFLTAAFLGPQESRNTSVLSLFIAGSGTDGDVMRLGVLPRVIRESKHIRQFVIQWHGDDGASREEMQNLFEALQVNSTIEALALPTLVGWDFPDPEDHGFIDVETFTQILKLVEDNRSIHKLELYIGECRGGSTDLNLDAFYRALRSNSTIRFLRLRGPFFTEIAESDFSNWLRATSTLRELQLENCDDDESPMLKSLFRALRDNKSLRKLKLEDFAMDEDDGFEELMNALRENSTIEEIVFDPECEREEEVREALKKNLEH